MNIIKETGDMVRDPETTSPPPVNNKLFTRIISALVMLPLAIYLILNGGLLFFFLVCALTTLILSEWNGIVEQKPLSVLVLVEVICANLLMFSLVWGNLYIEYTFICSLVSVLTVAYLVKAKIVWALTGFLYALLPSSAFLIISENYGGEIVLWMMILIWAMDTGAYFAGKNIGGPKMSPKISPNKTWSGLIGGAIAATICGGLYGYFYRTAGISLFDDATILLILSGLLGLLSQVGDLAESAVKRTFNAKDSGSIIPGHGGVMDRVDGVLFVAPTVLMIAYVLYGQ